MTTEPRSEDPSTIEIEDLDVSKPTLYENDTWAPLFSRLRREDPVHYCRDSAYGPYWSVTRFNDITAVELDHTTYAAAGRVQIEDEPSSARRVSFMRMDPPRHTQQRRTVAPVNAPSALASFEGIIRERTRALLDGLPRNNVFDWVDRVAVELTTMMLATLFDFPWEDRRKLAYWSDVATCDVNAPTAPVRSHDERFAELTRMGDYFRELWNQRAATPPKLDLISMMAHSDATREMPEREFIGNLTLLIVGGNDTTRNAMSGGLLALSENPGEWQKLRDRPALVGSLVEETVRFQTPIMHICRTAARDAALAGKQIKMGDKVVVWFISGNRDETVIDRADQFIVDREKPRQHLSYGAGIHRCVGDRLANLQLRILWEEVLQRGMIIDVVGPPKRLYSNFIRGITSLPVVVRG